MNIQSIVIASDLSARPDRAFQRWGLLARQSGAKVTLVSIVDDNEPDGIAAYPVKTCRAHLDASATSLAGDVAHGIRVETGDPIARQVDTVNSDDFNPVAVGATTRSVSFTGLGPFTADLVRDPPTDIPIARGAKSE